MVLQIVRDASEILKIIDAKFERKNDFAEVIGYADLWSPKKIFSSPYRGTPNGRKREISKITFILIKKNVLLCNFFKINSRRYCDNILGQIRSPFEFY